MINIKTEEIIEDPTWINGIICCSPKTLRKLHLGKENLIEIRKKMDKHIKNTYLKSVQAPIGVKPKLMTWMEIC